LVGHLTLRNIEIKNSASPRETNSSEEDGLYSRFQLYELRLQWLRALFRKDYKTFCVYQKGEIRCIAQFYPFEEVNGE
jgi:hypothetical protein